ncbi:hypothetical protein PHMEG_00029297 [Phytophthora megakarya]|uniref:Uncharacterized protein n=1 Tax=Phytophthora megakarya TaxID=4795 RepID=A0A225V409_9STRA|nr:hypothetical protein PHMEG_00029297 [Phytophthora megakarya]
MNRPDSRSKDTLDYAVLNGHLDVVQWLYSKRFDRNTDWAMYRAAGKGHLKMVKWLCENIPQNYTGHAIDKAVRSGHFRVAHWLLSRFPDYKIGTKLKSHKALFSGKKAGWSENTFDMLLWLDGHASYVFTPRFLEDLRQNLSYYSKHQTLFRHVLRWLDEHYPTTTRTSS